MIAEVDIKRQVRDFYNSVGWKQIGEGVYQNARYEDLRPVSREYIHRCHLRVARFLPPEGIYLLDAGSGPIQYPEYLEYSKRYRYRVCLDISSLAVKEARERLGDRGLYVVGDIAHLPFEPSCFEGIVSLHTIHHLPPGEHQKAFSELYEMLKPGGSCAIVYTWGEYSPLMHLLDKPMDWMTQLIKKIRHKSSASQDALQSQNDLQYGAENLIRSPGTFTSKHDYGWMKNTLQGLPGLEIRVWRTVSTKFLRVFIHRKTFGRFLLQLLFVMEEFAPRFFGRIGQYPLIVFQKPRELHLSDERINR